MGIFLWHEAYLVGADESIARIKHTKRTKGKKGEKEVRQAMFGASAVFHFVSWEPGSSRVC